MWNYYICMHRVRISVEFFGHVTPSGLNIWLLHFCAWRWFVFCFFFLLSTLIATLPLCLSFSFSSLFYLFHLLSIFSAGDTCKYVNRFIYAKFYNATVIIIIVVVAAACFELTMIMTFTVGPVANANTLPSIHVTKYIESNQSLLLAKRLTCAQVCVSVCVGSLFLHL